MSNITTFNTLKSKSSDGDKIPFNSAVSCAYCIFAEGAHKLYN